MDKKVKLEKNSFTVLDAFRFFFFLIIVTFAVSFVFEIMLVMIAGAKGMTFEEISLNETTQVISCMVSPIVFIIYYIVYAKIRNFSFKRPFSDGQRISLLPISVAIVLAIIAIFLFTPFMKLIEYGFMQGGYYPDNSIPLEEKMKASGKFFFLGLFVYALLPAVAEEIIFRGVIQKSLQSRYNGFVAISISTILFALMHGSLQQTVYQLIMGIMLGYVACVGGSILYSIILHFLNNAFVLLFGCFDIVSYLSEEVYYYNIYSMIFPICIFLLGLGLAGILFWVLKYLRTKNFFRIEPKKKKKSKKEEPQPVKKLGIAELWKNLTHLEKIFAIAGFAIILLIWIINTISGFTSA